MIDNLLLLEKKYKMKANEQNSTFGFLPTHKKINQKPKKVVFLPMLEQL